MRLRFYASPIAVALMLIVTACTLTAPPARAEGLAACDNPFVPTRCAAAVAHTSSWCAESSGSFSWPLFGEREVKARACVSVVGSAAASAAVAVGEAVVGSTASSSSTDGGSQKDPCAFSGILFQVITCTSGTMVTGECGEASATAWAQNALGVLALPIAKAKSGNCMSDVMMHVNWLMKLLHMDEPPGGTQMPLHVLPPELVVPLREEMQQRLLADLREASQGWPHDDLHTALRANLEVAAEDAAARAVGTAWVSVEEV